jgi:hypothetical protein
LVRLPISKCSFIIIVIIIMLPINAACIVL